MNYLAELSNIRREILGRRMTKEEIALQEDLRKRVKAGEITVEEAHRIWDREVTE